MKRHGGVSVVEMRASEWSEESQRADSWEVVEGWDGRDCFAGSIHVGREREGRGE